MTSRLTAPPAIVVGPDPATVSVAVDVPVAAAEAWDALFRPERVRQWLGELSGPWRPGPLLVDFDDGDFFDTEVTAVAPPSRLEFRWRFLGIGPCCQVRWRVGDGAPTRVEVTDSAPNRSGLESEELGAGWADFLARYRSYLSTGRRTRYPWREELDGAIELPWATRELLDAEVRARWLPLVDPAVAHPLVAVAAPEEAGNGARGGAGPWRLRVERAARPSPTRLELVMATEAGAGVSTCRFELRPAGAGGSLSFSHEGWQHLVADGDDRRRGRARFTRTWVDALVRARALLER